MNDVDNRSLVYQQAIDAEERLARWLKGSDPNVLERGAAWNAVHNRKRQLNECRKRIRVLRESAEQD